MLRTSAVGDNLTCHYELGRHDNAHTINPWWILGGGNGGPDIVVQGMKNNRGLTGILCGAFGARYRTVVLAGRLKSRCETSCTPGGVV